MSENEKENITKEEEVKDTSKVEEKAVESEDEIEDIDLDSLTDETQDIQKEYLEKTHGIIYKIPDGFYLENNQKRIYKIGEKTDERIA